MIKHAKYAKKVIPESFAEVAELFGGKRYYQVSTYLRRHFGQRTVKLAIDGGFTCPNRDGTKGRGGCIFCSDSGSGEFAKAIDKQGIDEQIGLYSRKWPDAKYLAYLQSHTNTYAPVEVLRKKYYDILSNPRVEGLVLGTRPDCLGDDVLELLSEINRSHFLWVEMGLQTVHEKTAELINRCYPLSVFDDAMKRLTSCGIRSVVHLILGLPGETREMMLESIKYVAACESLFGIKLHLLNVVRGSQMEHLYRSYLPFSCIDEYVELVAEALQYIPPWVTVHRLTGDAPREILISPPWSFNKRTILNRIDDRLSLTDSWQGKKAAAVLRL